MKKQRGRPAKPKGLRKDVDLRIPVTLDQKELVMEAARLEGVDMASWARPLLVRAAQAALEQNNSSNSPNREQHL